MKTDVHTADDHQAIHVTVSFDPVELKVNRSPFGMIIEMKDASVSGEYGGPALPARMIQVALPPQTKRISIHAVGKKTQMLFIKPEFVAPRQYPQPAVPRKETRRRGRVTFPDREPPIKPSTLRPGRENVRFPYPQSPFLPPAIDHYEYAIKHPRPFAELKNIKNIGPVPSARIQLAPIRFTRENLLEFATEIEVTILCEQASVSQAKRTAGMISPSIPCPSFVHPIHSRAQAERLYDLARMNVINPESVWEFHNLFLTGLAVVDHLIITDDVTWDAEAMAPQGSVVNLKGSFQQLADWKNQRGVRSRVVTISDIVNGQYGDFRTGSRDLQEIIRNFLKWAYTAWGISWVLLGGDTETVPVRRVAGAWCHISDMKDIDPPPENASFWTGTFLKMNFTEISVKDTSLLVRRDTGLFIPYDSPGSSGPSERGWYFCTDNTYAIRTPSATQYIRVNGPESEVKGQQLEWLVDNNLIPTDLYYASLQGPDYGRPGLHDWDLLDNGIYGQHTDDADFDGVEYETDVSVGRAPVSSEMEADAFVSKVIAYEKFRRPDGTSLDPSWPHRILIVASNFGGRTDFWPTASFPPEDNRYCHVAGSDHAIIKVRDIRTNFQLRLIAQIAGTDFRVIPYSLNAASEGRGWFYVNGPEDLTPHGYSFTFKGTDYFIPIPSGWIVVYGPGDELAPRRYIFDETNPDGSMTNQEVLREQIRSELPLFTSYQRLYEDEVDLTPDQTSAAPVEPLTADGLTDAINEGQHFVSFSGHGDAGDICGTLTRQIADSLENGYHAFIGYADSCLTNNFEEEVPLSPVSEHLLYNPHGGAVGYIGNTRFGWIGTGDDFQRAFFHQMTATHHLGLLNDCRVGMGDGDIYRKWEIFSLNLIGDPEMPVWTDTPKQLKVTYKKEADRETPFAVHVIGLHGKTWLPDLSGATVYIRHYEFIQVKTTDFSGKAVFDLKQVKRGKLHIIVSKDGYKPFFGVARIE